MSVIENKLSEYLGEKVVDWEKELKHAENAMNKYKVASYKSKDENGKASSNKMIDHWKNVIKEIKKALKSAR
jgi:hypothetical protein